MKEREMKELIIQGGNHQYLGQFMSDLPENVLLNKKTTGCGMTSVVLNNDVKYVLAVPYVNLILNKEQWCRERGIEVCTVYGKYNNEKVMSFTGNKIIVTYDSLGNVTKTLEERGDIKDWKICIDECHKLVDSAAFRGDAVDTVINNYKEYKSFVFGTATPVPDKYQLPALKHIPKARIQWDKLDEVKVNYCQYDRKINDVATIIAIDFLKGTRNGNAHIFINSVSSIVSIVRKLHKAGINMPEDIRIVCADNLRNQNLIESKLPGNYYISPVGSKVRKVNFYTSTAFEGCDIHDEEGKTFIVADGSKEFTKVNIATVLPQIIGRVRDSKYKGTVDLIFSKSPYLCKMTEEEFEKKMLDRLRQAKKLYAQFYAPDAEPMFKEMLLNNEDNPFIKVVGEDIELVVNAHYNEMYKFSTINKTYYVNSNGSENVIADGVKKFNDIDYKYTGIEEIEIKGFNKLKLGRKASFKDLCLDYIKILESEPSMIKSGQIVEMRKKNNLIVEAYKELSADKIKALRFRKKDIQEELLSTCNNVSVNSKIITHLGLRKGQWISCKKAKNNIQIAYDKLNIKKSAKSTDLKIWYDITSKIVSKGGTKQRGYIIGIPKFKVVNT